MTDIVKAVLLSMMTLFQIVSGSFLIISDKIIWGKILGWLAFIIGAVSVYCLALEHFDKNDKSEKEV